MRQQLKQTEGGRGGGGGEKEEASERVSEMLTQGVKFSECRKKGKKIWQPWRKTGKRNAKRGRKQIDRKNSWRKDTGMGESGNKLKKKRKRESKTEKDGGGGKKRVFKMKIF